MPKITALPKIVHILHKIGFATANVVQIGLFLLSAIAYSKNVFYLCTSNPPKGVARSFKDFPPASARRARIRNTRGIENGISLNRDTNTIEALAALHIPGPHMMHTESRPARHGAETVDVGNHAAPVTIRRKRLGRDRDPNNLSVARV